ILRSPQRRRLEQRPEAARRVKRAGVRVRKIGVRRPERLDVKQLDPSAAKPSLGEREKCPSDAPTVMVGMNREYMDLARLGKVPLERNEADHNAAKPGNERREPRQTAEILLVGRGNAEPLGERLQNALTRI